MPDIATHQFGPAQAPVVIFAHGWGRSHADMIPAAELVADRARVVLLDLPGFGQSPRPEAAWGTGDYATHLRDYIVNDLGYERFIWVGHSFGARIGLRMAAAAASPIDHLVVVAGAGVRVPPSLRQRLSGAWRGRMFRLRRRFAGPDQIEALERRYGSPDYVQSRQTGLRDIFVKTVQEDQSDSVGAITCPTTLIYGAKDTETPPAQGRLLHRLVPGSVYIEPPAFDHLSVLSRGRHQIAVVLKDILGGSAR